MNGDISLDVAMIRYGMPGESVTEYCFIGGYWAMWWRS